MPPPLSRVSSSRAGVNGSGLARLDVVRLVATPAALDAASWPDDAMPLRTAPDEVLLVGQGAPLDAPDVLAARAPDSHVIAIADTSFAGVWLPADVAATVLSRVCEWALPAHRPAFAQGAMAELPVKLWLEEERTLIVVPAPFATDLVERVL